MTQTIQDGSTVTLSIIVTSAGTGETVSGDDDTLAFTCGRGETFEGIEQAVLGKAVGDVAYVQLEPEEHVGEYDAELVRVEERAGFPDAVEEGMVFEGLPNATADDTDAQAKHLFLVTDVTDEVVVLDGNHPLAGMALRFQLTVVSIEAPGAAPAPEDDDDAAADFAPNFKAISRP